MIKRDITNRLISLSQKYPIVTITGPRQSGKSTLLRHVFNDYRYVSLEDIDMRLFASEDPRGFISTYNDKTIIDEIQQVPSLLSYIQTYTDINNKEGMYMLAISHNLYLMQSVSQSLAGKIAILTLLPFSHKELAREKITFQTTDEEIYKGSYPRIYDKNIEPLDYYPFYMQTYVERDARQLKNIENLNQFAKFIRLCAGRIGQLLNLSSLAVECGITTSTASSWLSVLEASYICYCLKPDYNNFNKRLVKTPKLYFYDTGLACYLLDIRNKEQLETHYLRDGLFENMVINEFAKNSYNEAIEPDLFFWRDNIGNEIDLIQYIDGQPNAFEIKSGATFSSDYFKGLIKWSKLSSSDASRCNVIYNGDIPLKTANGQLISWKNGI